MTILLVARGSVNDFYLSYWIFFFVNYNFYSDFFLLGASLQMQIGFVARSLPVLGERRARSLRRRVCVPTMTTMILFMILFICQIYFNLVLWTFGNWFVATARFLSVEDETFFRWYFVFATIQFPFRNTNTQTCIHFTNIHNALLHINKKKKLS